MRDKTVSERDAIILWTGNLTILLISVFLALWQGLGFSVFVAFGSALMFNGV
jgi:hypothetical protein